MICWAYLIFLAARRQHARHAHRHSVRRIEALLQQRRTIDTELLAALRAESVSQSRLNFLEGV